MSKEHVFFGKFLIKEKDGTDEYTVSAEPMSDKEKDALAGIVRCRDCVHSSVSFDETRTTCRYWSMNDYDDSESSHGYTVYPVVKPDGYCAWGVRRGDE